MAVVNMTADAVSAWAVVIEVPNHAKIRVARAMQLTEGRGYVCNKDQDEGVSRKAFSVWVQANHEVRDDCKDCGKQNVEGEFRQSSAHEIRFSAVEAVEVFPEKDRQLFAKDLKKKDGTISSRLAYGRES